MDARSRTRMRITVAATLVGAAVGAVATLVVRIFYDGNTAGTIVVDTLIGAVVGVVAGLLIWGAREDGEANDRTSRRERGEASPPR